LKPKPSHPIPLFQGTDTIIRAPITPVVTKENVDWVEKQVEASQASPDVLE
jgi:hypothetical protein